MTTELLDFAVIGVYTVIGGIGYIETCNNMIKLAKPFNYSQNILPRGLSAPALTVYMYKMMILLNDFSFENIGPVFSKFHVEPSLKGVLRVC